jgi:hypothetical protein
MDIQPSQNLSQSRKPSTADYGRIEDFLNVFSKGIKTSVLYPPENAIPREFKQSCWKKLKSYLNEYGYLSLDVYPESFKERQHVIFKAPSREENLAGLLHRDGIRHLTFKADLEHVEWEGFFDDILTVFRDRDNYEDLVNLFWQRDFLSIEYDAVDDFSFAEYSGAFGSKSSPDIEYVDIVLTESQVEAANPLDALNPEKPDSSESSLEQNAFYDRLFVNIQKFSSEERQYVESLLARDEELVIEFEAIDLIFDVLRSEKELGNFDESIEAIQTMFDKMLESEQFPLLVFMVKRMKAALEDIRQKSATQAEKLKDCLARSGDRIRIAKITNLLNRSANKNLDGIRLYIEELDWDSLPSLIWMLGELNYFPARKMLIQALVNKGRERIDVIGNAVYDSRWYVIRNCVLILGEIRSARAITYLKKPLEHFDERVRWEALIAIEKIDSPKGFEHLIPLLFDESDRIRDKVIELFASNSYGPAFKALSGMVSANDFVHFDIDEQKNIILAMGLSGGEEAIPLLKKIIRKRRLFGAEKFERQKEAAILALFHIGSQTAVEFLGKLAKKKRGAVARYAHLALEKLERRQAGESEDER